MRIAPHVRVLPGSILADGSISTVDGGATYRGPVFVTAERARIAKRFGWRESAYTNYSNEFVAVYR